MKPRVIAPVLFLCLAITLPAPVTFTWSGEAGDNLITTPANWTGGVAPTLGGGEILSFPDDLSESVSFVAGQIEGLVFGGSSTLSPGNIVMQLGAGGINFVSSGEDFVQLGLRLNLTANQTWHVSADNFLRAAHNTQDIQGPGMITKTGAGTLEFRHLNDTWSGGLVFNEGRVIVGARSSFGITDTSYGLGTGPLVFGPPTGTSGLDPVLVTKSEGFAAGGIPFAVWLSNPITLNGVLNIENPVGLSLNGTVTLNADTTLRLKGQSLNIHNWIVDGPSGSPAPRKLTINGSGVVYLNSPSLTPPANQWSGGTHVENGVLVFQDAYAVPDAGLITVASQGYAGYQGLDNTESLVVSQFLARLSPGGITGTIGFDTPSGIASRIFTPAIDLTGFHADARLGSSSVGILSSTAIITPQGANYRFGGGGGHLRVESALTGTHGLVLDSTPDRPLTLRLTSTNNSFTGATTLNHSALIFAPGAFGTIAATPSITLQAGAYAGTEDGFTGLSARIHAPSPGMIGLDNDPAAVTARTYSDPLSLAGFTHADGLWLGTSSFLGSGATRAPGVIINSASITPQGSTYRFGAFKGGFLEIASVLAGAHSVVIGDPNSPASFGNFQTETYSTVRLSGDNTHTGNTTFHAGQLELGHNHALGTGSLVVAPINFTFPDTGDDHEPAPWLTARIDGIQITNPIVLQTDVEVGGSKDLTLAGNISGSGALRLGGDFSGNTNIGLSGNNTFTGGLFFTANINAIVSGNQALGPGPLHFTDNIGYVYFEPGANNIVINGLSSDRAKNARGAFYLDDSPGAVTTLTINQATDTQFDGEFYTYERARLVKSGAGAIHSEAGYIQFDKGIVEPTLPGSPEISLQINQGTWIFAENFEGYDFNGVGYWVHGGQLLLRDVYLENKIFVDQGGRLSGFGAYASAHIGAGGILDPGVADHGHVGEISFYDLTLAPGGTLEWNVRTADPLAGDHDLVSISGGTTLHVTAGTTADNPLTEVNEDDRFTLKLISLQANGTPGTLTGLSGERSYTWTIFDASSSSINGFSPDKFIIDASLFFTDLPIATLELWQQGNLIQLTFQPVPEPSTYALLVLGIGFIGLTVWRKSRRSR